MQTIKIWRGKGTHKVSVLPKLNPNKAWFFGGNFSLGEGGQFHSLFIFQEEFLQTEFLMALLTENFFISSERLEEIQ